MRQPYNCSLIIQFIQLQAARPSLEKKEKENEGALFRNSLGRGLRRLSPCGIMAIGAQSFINNYTMFRVFRHVWYIKAIIRRIVPLCASPLSSFQLYTACPPSKFCASVLLSLIFLGLRHSNSIILIQIVPAWTKTPRFWGTFVLSLAWSEAQVD